MGSKALKIGCVNITMHPDHSAELYKKLFTYVCSEKLRAKIHGKYHGVINTASYDNGSSAVSGSFYRFFDLPNNTSWVDLELNRPMDPDTDDVPHLPEEKKPEFRAIEYVFFVHSHRLFFNCQYITPASMERFLNNLFSTACISDRFNSVQANIEMSVEGLEKILGIAQKDRIKIFIQRPNPDDLTACDANILERFKNINVKNSTSEYKSDGSDITPDEAMKNEMNVALSNGYVTASGKDGEEKIEESTRNHPLVETVRYDSNRTTIFDLIFDVGINTVLKINARMKRKSHKSNEIQ